MLLLISSVGRTVLHNAEGVPSHVRDAQDRLVGLVLAVVDGSLVDSGFESFARLRHVVERFLEILVQAGSHGGAHRVAKAAELVYCDVFDVVEVSGSDLLQAFRRPDRRRAGLGNGTKLVISIIAHARTKLFHSYRNIRYCARFGTRKIDRRATIQASRAHVRRV